MSYKFDSSAIGLIFKQIKAKVFLKEEGEALQTKVTNLENSIGEMGGGDMLKATYDANGDGKVDTAANAEKLGGQLPSYYASVDAVATAKQEAIDTVLGEGVDADFDTLKEVAAWIQSDTTDSAELITRVTNIETNYVKSADLTALTEEEIETAWNEA